MTRAAPLVSVAVRVAAAAAALLALSAVLVSCGDVEEETSPDVGSPRISSSPVSSAPHRSSTPVSLKDYVDTNLGFSLSYPANLNVKEETFELSEKDGTPAITQRVLIFSDASGLPGMRLGVAPNPSGLSLKDWVRTYPGWPSEPSEITVADEPALMFPVNQMGEANPVIYFEHGGYVYGITRLPSAREIDGTPESVLSELEYKAVLDSFRFPQ